VEDGMSDGSGHWDADLFRREGHRMVDWIAEYLHEIQ
jgi:hypothetical protein